MILGSARKDEQGFRNIAIVRLSAVGDVLMAMPAVRALRRAWPEARISWIVESRARSLLEGFDAVDELIDFPAAAWKKSWKRPFGGLRSVPEIARFYLGLRRRRFDLAVDFQGNLKSASCTFMTRARTRLGFGRKDCGEPNWLATNRRLDLRGQALHRVDRDLLLAAKAGARPRFEPLALELGEAEEQEAERFLASLSGSGPLVAFHPGTSAFMPHKRWAISSWIALARKLTSEGARVLLSWGPGDEERVEAIRSGCDGLATPFPDTPSMRALAALLLRMDLVVGGDTGPVHLAALSGVPTLTLIGPGDPRHYYPYGHPDRALYLRAPCSPCRNRSCQDLQCMEGISVDAVSGSARAILAR